MLSCLVYLANLCQNNLGIMAHLKSTDLNKQVNKLIYIYIYLKSYLYFKYISNSTLIHQSTNHNNVLMNWHIRGQRTCLSVGTNNHF